MARVCHCTGYMHNPGGVCCQDLQRGSVRFFTDAATPEIKIADSQPSAEFRRIVALLGDLSRRLERVELELIRQAHEKPGE